LDDIALDLERAETVAVRMNAKPRWAGTYVALIENHVMALSTALTVALGSWAGSANAESAEYALDPLHSSVYFEVLHLGTSTTRGRFDRVEGTARLDKDAPSVDVQVKIDTGSVSTGILALDAFLRGENYLETGEHPQAIFTAKGGQWREGKLVQLDGQLTLRGITKPLSLRAERWRCYRNLLILREVCGGDFDTEITRSDFGIIHGIPFVADRVRLIVQVEGIRQ